MMEKYEIKKCGTCIHFGKNSCAHPAAKIDCFACMKYEEQKEPLDYYEFTNVYKVNDDIVVANTIEEAIKLWKKSRLIGYDSDYIKKVELMYYDAKIKSNKDDENTTATMQDCVSSKDYVAQCDYTAKADEKD